MGPLVHFELTREWARDAGMGDLADRVARADVSVDFEHPARGSFANLTRHFAPWAHFWVWRYLRLAIATRSPEALGRALHASQDAVSHGVLGLAHIRFQLGWGRNPDDWAAAPERIRARIRARSYSLVRRYLDGV